MPEQLTNLSFGVVPCPWCKAPADAEDAWGALISHRPGCYWRNNKGDVIGRVRVNNSEKAMWNQCAHNQSEFQRGMERAAEIAFNAVLAIERSEHDYSILQKAAQVAAAIRSAAKEEQEL